MLALWASYRPGSPDWQRIYTAAWGVVGLYGMFGSAIKDWEDWRVQLSGPVPLADVAEQCVLFAFGCMYNFSRRASRAKIRFKRYRFYPKFHVDFGVSS